VARNNRRKARVDDNQNDIVAALRDIPGVTVETDHDDLFIGYNGRNYWIELKSERAVSKLTGNILESQLKESQKRLRDTWKGHYAICWTIDQILKEIGIK